MPWELTPAEFRVAADEARALRAQAGRQDALEMVAPLSAAADDGAGALLERVATWRAAGATAFHTGIEAGSFAGYLERLAWFGREVIARAG